MFSLIVPTINKKVKKIINKIKKLFVLQKPT